jgi:hypothetical protein
MDFYLLEQDLRIPGIAAVGAVPEDVEPLDWMTGRRMPAPQGNLRLNLSTNSGTVHTDIMGSLLTLFSDALKSAMTQFGIGNIDYFPVELVNPLNGQVQGGWWLANVIGMISCVDAARSRIVPEPGDLPGILESFYVDESKVGNEPIFRLREKPTLIVINAALRQHIQASKLSGVRVRHTRTYDGF